MKNGVIANFDTLNDPGKVNLSRLLYSTTSTLPSNAATTPPVNPFHV